MTFSLFLVNLSLSGVTWDYVGLRATSALSLGVLITHTLQTISIGQQLRQLSPCHQHGKPRLTPGFGQASPWTLQALRGVSQEMEVLSEPTAQLLIQLCANVYGKKQMMALVFESLPPIWETRWSICVLGTTCPSSDCCGHVGRGCMQKISWCFFYY